MRLTGFQVRTPFGQRLAMSERDRLREFADQLAAYEEDDKEGFAAVVYACLSRGITQSQLADEFRVLAATISRWASGKSVPPAYSRGNIVARIRRLILDEVEAMGPLLKDAAIG